MEISYGNITNASWHWSGFTLVYLCHLSAGDRGTTYHTISENWNIMDAICAVFFFLWNLQKQEHIPQARQELAMIARCPVNWHGRWSQPTRKAKKMPVEFMVPSQGISNWQWTMLEIYWNHCVPTMETHYYMRIYLLGRFYTQLQACHNNILNMSFFSYYWTKLLYHQYWWIDLISDSWPYFAAVLFPHSWSWPKMVILYIYI